ncbi:MAG: thiol peroxidase [Candidatus Fermentibacteria bacterium]|nr:thiol peroxidase [Candidatus Fermentibacteria bacterium]
MAIVTLQGNQIETVGALPEEGMKAPNFSLTAGDLSMKELKNYAGRVKVLNIFTSLDTGVCAASVRRFNKEASGLDNTVVLCISADLPFAHSRFCEAEGLKDVISLSTFRSPEFGRNYGTLLTTGPLAGLMTRAVVILDSSNLVVYTELVPEISQEPDYEAALSVLKDLG